MCGIALTQPMPAPELISYQGALYQQDGVSPYTGMQDIEFRLYQGEADLPEQALWVEKHSKVQVLKGAFSVYLGNGEAIEGAAHGALADVFGTAPLWLGVKVGLDDEMAQRQKIMSVPYALTATSVNKATHGVRPGTIVMYAGRIDSGLPEGWLLCDGAAHSRMEYADLFNTVGTTWGAGDGSTTFNVPDLRGKAVIGSGGGAGQNTDTRFGSQAGLVSRNPGTVVGQNAVALSVSEIPPHAHGYTDTYGTPNYDTWGAYGTANSVFRDDTRKSGISGGGGAHSNMQPSVYVSFLIKR